MPSRVVQSFPLSFTNHFEQYRKRLLALTISLDSCFHAAETLTSWHSIPYRIICSFQALVLRSCPISPSPAKSLYNSDPMSSSNLPFVFASKHLLRCSNAIPRQCETKIKSSLNAETRLRRPTHPPAPTRLHNLHHANRQPTNGYHHHHPTRRAHSDRRTGKRLDASQHVDGYNRVVADQPAQSRWRVSILG